jgi:coproporphyrinogen III oxidase-like Fe-S oxidoreductase
MLSAFLGFVTRYEGRKFLKLSEKIDESEILGPAPRDSEEVSLYIHIPFCRTLCPYCCFNRCLFNEDKAKRYFKNLRKELALYIQKGFKFSTFYFGGGTPTVLMDELLEFISYLKTSFEVRQISVETTARELSDESVNLLKDAGVNRLSIGVQSFDDDILKAMGRAWCTGEEIKEKILIARGKFDTLNLDFIFNFPSQSIEKFKEDVDILKSLGVDQVTFYPLMPSPHKKNALERRFNQVNTSREKRFYDVILNSLCTNGYDPSTTWCFSRGERMIDEYVVDFDDYIGIGSGSVSLLRGNFYVNSFSLNRYEEFVTKNKLPIIRWRRLSEHELLYYYLLSKLLGLKLDTRKFYHRFNADIHKKLRKELLFLKFFGLIQEDGDRINVTPKGMYPVNVIMREFFSSLNGLREYCIENQI